MVIPVNARCHTVLQTIALVVVLVAVPSGPVKAQTTIERSPSLTIRLKPYAEAKSSPVVTSVAIHPAGKLVAVAGDDHVVRILDIQTGRVTRYLKGHDDWIRTVRFSSDGDMLATAGDDRRILLWDMSEEKEPRLLAKQSSAIYAVRLSPDGRLLAAVGFDQELTLYDVSKGTVVRNVECPCRDMRAIAFSDDGKQLTAGGRNGKLRVWDVASGKIIWEQAAHQRRIRTIAFSPNGRHVLSAGEGQTIRILDAKSGDEVVSLEARGVKVLAAIYCGADRVASAGTDNVVRIWDLIGAKERVRLIGHTGSVAALDYHDATGVLVSGGYDTTVRIWKLNELIEDRQATRPRPPAPASR